MAGHRRGSPGCEAAQRNWKKNDGGQLLTFGTRMSQSSGEGTGAVHRPRRSIPGDLLHPVLGQKRLPSCLPNALRCRLDPVALQNVGNRAARHVMTQIRRRPLDSQITPIAVFSRHADYQGLDLLGSGQTTRLAPAHYRHISRR